MTDYSIGDSVNTIICMPHCGAKPNSTSGGEVAEREVLAHVPPDIDAHVYAPTLPGLRWWNSPLWFEAPLRRCLLNHGPALIRVHSLRYTGLAALAARRLTGVPITAHFHHLDADCLSWLDRFVLTRVNQVTTDSTFSQKQAADVGASARVVRLGVDHARFSPSPIPSGCMVLLIGGSKPRKNTAFVRALWPEVVRQVPTAVLVEVGQDCAVSDVELRSAYYYSRVVVFPSLLEGFGLPVLEAMACARPVVVSDRGALVEFGIETTPLVPERWVERLVVLLTNSRQWSQEAERNARLSRAYSWEKTAHEFATLWRLVT